jgi:hypothetical protein
MKRHPVEIFSLVSGLAFLAFAGAYLVGAGLDRYPDARIALPLLLVGLGAGGLAAVLRAQKRSDEGSPTVAGYDTSAPTDRAPSGSEDWAPSEAAPSALGHYEAPATTDRSATAATSLEADVEGGGTPPGESPGGADRPR